MRILFVGAALLLTAGCGDPLVGGQYLGDPQATLAGTFAGFISGSEKPVSPHMGVVWLKVVVDNGQPAPQFITAATPIASSEFPWNFTFHVYELPPPAALNQLRSPTDPIGGVLGFGRADILLFDDVDRDGAFEFDFDPSGGGPPDLRGADQFIGLAFDHRLVWFDENDVPSQGPLLALPTLQNPEDWSPGYQVLRMNCGQPVELVDGITTVVVDLFSASRGFPSRAPCP